MLTLIKKAAHQGFKFPKGCASIHSGAENTIDTAGNLPDSEVFSRPKFKGFGRGECLSARTAAWLYPCFRPRVHPDRPKSEKDGFQSHTGAKAMTTVNTITTPKTGNTATLARQQAIENALTTALYFIRLPSTDSGLRAATGRAIRATAMLKQACAEISNGRKV